MKHLLLTILLLASVAAAGQYYTFKRAHALGTDAKIAGAITVTDTTIVIRTQDFPESAFDVCLETNVPGFKQFWVLMPEGSVHEIRITLTDPSPAKQSLKKGETGTLFVEHKDLFTGAINDVLYYLIKE